MHTRKTVRPIPFYHSILPSWTFSHTSHTIINLTNFPAIPLSSNFLNNLTWLTLSKAFQASRGVDWNRGSGQPNMPSINGPPPALCRQNCRQLCCICPAVTSQHTAISASSINGLAPANCRQNCHHRPGRCPANARQIQATSCPANDHCPDFSITKIT